MTIHLIILKILIFDFVVILGGTLIDLMCLWSYVVYLYLWLISQKIIMEKNEIVFN